MAFIKIEEKYRHLESFIKSIPERFEREGVTIYTGRNLIKTFTVNGIKINVKRYCVPNPINRIIYSFFRKSKGIRAFTYPKKLLSEGFETPEPIAYIEEHRYGLIHYSYFISLQSSYENRFYQFGDASYEEYIDIVQPFAQYVAQLHEAGIMHKDFSPGNILFDKIDGKYHFCLVDINRMHFGEVSLQKGCANFARLWGPKDFFIQLAKEYALARNSNQKECEKLILTYRKNFWKRFKKRHKVKYKLEL